MGIFSRKQKKEDKQQTDLKAADLSDAAEKKTEKMTSKAPAAAPQAAKKEVKKRSYSAKDEKGKPPVTKVAEGKSMKELYGEEEIKTPVSVKAGKKEKKIRHYGNAHKVLIKPLITEKAANLGTENKYVFEAAVSANKIEIAKAINEVYGIMPVSVNIINMQGKKVRSGKFQGKRKSWKKAIVMLPKDKTINIYEGV